MISFLLLFFFSYNLYSAGFAKNTLLSTNHGQITFNNLDCNTLIQSHENYFQPVLFLNKQFVEKIVHITIADEIITCHPEQLFWCVNKSSWICVKDLFSSDLLQTIDNQYITIDKVEKVQRQTEIYSLTVGPPHYLYVGNQKILAHNMAWFVGLGVELAFGCGTIEFIKGSFVVALGFIVIKIQDHFAKNRDKKKPKMSVSVQPVCKAPFFDPNDNEDEDDFFTRLKDKSTKYARTTRFGKMYKDPETGLWWSKDLEQHGGSCFKVFKETAKSFEWVFDADHMGNRIVGKNKGPVGMSIPFSEVIFRT